MDASDVEDCAGLIEALRECAAYEQSIAALASPDGRERADDDPVVTVDLIATLNKVEIDEMLADSTDGRITVKIDMGLDEVARWVEARRDALHARLKDRESLALKAMEGGYVAPAKGRGRR